MGTGWRRRYFASVARRRLRVSSGGYQFFDGEGSGGYDGWWQGAGSPKNGEYDEGNDGKCSSRHGIHDGGLSEVMGSDGKNESLGLSRREVIAKTYDSKARVGQPCVLPLRDPPKRISVWPDVFDDEWLPMVATRC